MELCTKSVRKNRKKTEIKEKDENEREGKTFDMI